MPPSVGYCPKATRGIESAESCVYYTHQKMDPLQMKGPCCVAELQTRWQLRIDAGMNFGVRVAFDYGNCTGPSCVWDWQTLG